LDIPSLARLDLDFDPDAEWMGFALSIFPPHLSSGAFLYRAFRLKN
jgi:hypothetical protein